MKPDLLAKTIETWQPLSPVQLTEEDAVEIVTSMKGFLGILREWSEAGRDRLPEAIAASPLPETRRKHERKPRAR